jgi:hypothetical protein
MEAAPVIFEALVGLRSSWPLARFELHGLHSVCSGEDGSPARM